MNGGGNVDQVSVENGGTKLVDDETIAEGRKFILCIALFKDGVDGKGEDDADDDGLSQKSSITGSTSEFSSPSSFVVLLLIAGAELKFIGFTDVKVAIEKVEDDDGEDGGDDGDGDGSKS